MKYLRTRNTKKTKMRTERKDQRHWTESKGGGESGSQVESGE